MNPLTEPGMEPTEARGPVVPQPATSAEFVTGAQGSGEPATATGSVGSAGPGLAESELPTSTAGGPGGSSPQASTPAAREEQPAEAIVLIEEAPRSAATGHAVAAAQAAVGGLSNFVRGTATLARRHKLEAVAVLLLGVGGAVYPPVWVLGVLVALPSKMWDLRDKWTGIVAPVLLVIASTVLIVVLGGRHGTVGSYVYEAWLGAGRVSRIAAALGAGYLFWRLRHGRREPKQPPWNVPHRLG